MILVFTQFASNQMTFIQIMTNNCSGRYEGSHFRMFACKMCRPRRKVAVLNGTADDDASVSH